MPCFNHAEFVGDSVEAILRQSHPDLELVVVDDCSTDRCSEILSRFSAEDPRVKPIRHLVNQGLSRSRNDALRAARGDYIAFCDADDVWEPNKLQVQLEQLQKNSDYALAYCDTLIIDERGAPTGRYFTDLFPPPASPSGRLFPQLLKSNFINIQSVLLRRECVERIGPFDERIEWVQDWWYWIQLSRHYQFLYDSEPLARYRVHSRSTNRVFKRAYNVNRFRVYRRILREFRDLSKGQRAELFYQMGIELCLLGKTPAGHGLFRKVVGTAWTNPQSLVYFCKALVRLLANRPAPLATRQQTP
jgi:glycosyltransferase involved in cell wall biosynthesis